MQAATDKHLVVFGAGYVGSEIARQAVARGMRVTALTRNAEKAAALRAAGVETVVADLADDAWHGHAALAGGADFVLNCVSSGGGGTEGYRRSYVEGMRSVRAWRRRTGTPGHLIYTGSTSVYPQGGGVRVDEDCPAVDAGEDTGPGLLRQAELVAQACPGLNTVLRLAGIYGPGRHQLLDRLRAAPATIPGAGEHHLNLIHREDACAAVWAAWGAGSEGVFNVADDGAATRAEVVGWLAERLGVAAPQFTGEAADGRSRVTPDRVIANDRLKRVSGWRPRYPSFREGYGAILEA